MSNKNASTTFSSHSLEETKKKRRNDSKFDPSKLRELIKAGKTAKQIMEFFSLSHKQILKHHVLRLCSLDGCYYDIPGLYGQNARKAYVSGKGAVIIKNALVDWKNLKLEPDKTVFDVEVDDVQKKIIITVIEQNPVMPKAPSEDSRTTDGGDAISAV